jgi:hypothetical protein
MDMDNKLFLVTDVYKILDKYSRAEITINEVVDTLNTAAEKWKQRELLINIMKQDEENGLYDL